MCIRDRGYTEISQIISQHHGLQKTLLNEAAIVFLSDKLIQETERVTIEKRFAESLCKCNSPEALKSHERQLKQALDLQNMIKTICHMKMCIRDSIISTECSVFFLHCCYKIFCSQTTCIT